jgi:hypothetical protein
MPRQKKNNALDYNTVLLVLHYCLIILITIPFKLNITNEYSSLIHVLDSIHKGQLLQAQKQRYKKNIIKYKWYKR